MLEVTLMHFAGVIVRVQMPQLPASILVLQAGRLR